MQWHWTLNTVTNECSILCNILMSQFVCSISILLINIISLISDIKKMYSWAQREQTFHWPIPRCVSNECSGLWCPLVVILGRRNDACCATL